MFTDGGNVQLDHAGNFGTGGDFGFHQSNSGWELGLDARPGDHLAVGVLLANSQGTQHLDAGTNRLDGSSVGVYGTWFGDHGFYLDASLRWTGIDAHLQSGEGRYSTTASANAFNLEAGFTAWTLGSGVRITPQAQYTRTKVSDMGAIRSNNTVLDEEGGTSSRGRLGVALDATLQGTGFTWTPYGSLNAVHEFDGEYAYSINDTFHGTTNAGGTSAMVEFGVGARRDAWSVTGSVNWTDGGAQQNVLGGQLVVRYSW
jgi:outer membrane autotransporter protein